MNKRTKIIIFGVIGTLSLLIIVFFLLVPKQPAGTISVTIQAVPRDSTITLDGQVVQAGQHFLTYGKHTLKATRQYFDEVTQVVDTSTLEKAQTIYLLPIPTSSEAIKWLQDHPDIQQQREAAGAAGASQRQKLYAGKYPFINNLPYEAIDFKVNYGFSADNSLVLTVTLNPYSDPQSDPADYHQQLKDYKAEALEFLKTNNIDPKNISITWVPKDPDQ